jgi:serine/threonine protein kinase
MVREKIGNPNHFFAMKIINKKMLMEYASAEVLKREVKIQKRLDHPHVIKLYHFFEDKENVYLILEYAEKGSLFRYLRKKKKLSEEEAFIFFFQTCSGIDYLHKKNVLHRDLKPENLLLDNGGNIKLCDFGWSTDDAGQRSTFCGTVDYMAPEMIQNKPHDFKIDIWSLGVLLYELLHGCPPFRGKTNEEKFNKILTGDIQFFGVSNEAQDVIISLLKHDPKLRPSFDQIFNHPWLKIYEQKFKLNIPDYIYVPKRRPMKKRSGDISEVSPVVTPTKRSVSSNSRPDGSVERNLSVGPKKVINKGDHIVKEEITKEPGPLCFDKTQFAEFIPKSPGLGSRTPEKISQISLDRPFEVMPSNNAPLTGYSTAQLAGLTTPPKSKPVDIVIDNNSNIPMRVVQQKSPTNNRLSANDLLPNNKVIPSPKGNVMEKKPSIELRDHPTPERVRSSNVITVANPPISPIVRKSGNNNPLQFPQGSEIAIVQAIDKPITKPFIVDISVSNNNIQKIPEPNSKIEAESPIKLALHAKIKDVKARLRLDLEEETKSTLSPKVVTHQSASPINSQITSHNTKPASPKVSSPFNVTATTGLTSVPQTPTLQTTPLQFPSEEFINPGAPEGKEYLNRMHPYMNTPAKEQSYATTNIIQNDQNPSQVTRTSRVTDVLYPNNDNMVEQIDNIMDRVFGRSKSSEPQNSSKHLSNNNNRSNTPTKPEESLLSEILGNTKNVYIPPDRSKQPAFKVKNPNQPIPINTTTLHVQQPALLENLSVHTNHSYIDHSDKKMLQRYDYLDSSATKEKKEHQSSVSNNNSNNNLVAISTKIDVKEFTHKSSNSYLSQAINPEKNITANVTATAQKDTINMYPNDIPTTIQVIQPSQGVMPKFSPVSRPGMGKALPTSASIDDNKDLKPKFNVQQLETISVETIGKVRVVERSKSIEPKSPDIIGLQPLMGVKQKIAMLEAKMNQSPAPSSQPVIPLLKLGSKDINARTHGPVSDPRGQKQMDKKEYEKELDQSLNNPRPFSFGEKDALPIRGIGNKDKSMKDQKKSTSARAVPTEEKPKREDHNLTGEFVPALPRKNKYLNETSKVSQEEGFPQNKAPVVPPIDEEAEADELAVQNDSEREIIAERRTPTSLNSSLNTSLNNTASFDNSLDRGHAPLRKEKKAKSTNSSNGHQKSVKNGPIPEAPDEEKLDLPEKPPQKKYKTVTIATPTKSPRDPNNDRSPRKVGQFEEERSQMVANYKANLIQIEDKFFGTETSKKLTPLLSPHGSEVNDSARQYLAKKLHDTSTTSNGESLVSSRSNRYTGRRKPGALDPQALDHPYKVEEYLMSKTADKDLDMGFLDRKLIYTKHTIDESTQKLIKKNEELDDLVKDLSFRENKMISRKSYRNTNEEIRNYKPPEPEPGFMGFIRNFFTCANR